MSDEEHSMLTQNFLKRFEEVEKEVDAVAELLKSGQPAPLQDVKDKIEALCHDVQAAPADTSAVVKPEMEKMISKLDELAHSLKTD